MPNENAARQTPGVVKIDLTPGSEKIEIDGFRLEQHVSGLKLSYSVQHRRPVLLLDLLPFSVEVTGPDVELHKDLKDYLTANGWQAPR
jgi:hypothetical protein